MEERKEIGSVKLIDELGEETAFEHVLTFMHEGDRYVALIPADADDISDSDDESEVVLLKIEHRDGEDVYVSIDNEVLLDEVFDVFLDLIDELDDEDHQI